MNAATPKGTRIMNGRPIIDVRRVRKCFGPIEVLKEVSLRVAPSQVTCIIGPSGSGKSTLLRCIAFLEAYDGGEIFIEGKLLGYVDEGGKRRRARWAPEQAHFPVPGRPADMHCRRGNAAGRRRQRSLSHRQRQSGDETGAQPDGGGNR